MIEVKEVLRLWLAGVRHKRIAAQLGLDPKTVRRYVRQAEQEGLRREDTAEALTDEVVAAVMVALKTPPRRDHGEAWKQCEAERETIKKYLDNNVRLSRCRRLLRRKGVHVPYATLHRFAVSELGFGRRQVTVRVADGKPGEELEVDTGWMTLLEPDTNGRRRRFRAFIFTPNVSRYRFVYPVWKESTEQAIEACEAAWEFYGGVFGVLKPDNTKAIVVQADPLEPKIQLAFLEYAQARDFHVDPCRARKATDKARVERSVVDVREDCFRGEQLQDLEQAHRRALYWAKMEYGMRRHSTTHRLPREYFETVEAPLLKPPPTEAYDIPVWAEPLVARDHLAQVAMALYSLSTRWIGYKVHARADRSTVRFYFRGELIKTHPRQPPGGRSIDATDFPEHKRPYAMRDIAFLQRQATECGPAVGQYAARLLEGPLPWTRMRQVYALLGLVRRYGAERVNENCTVALAADMLSVKRLKKILEIAQPPVPQVANRSLPPGRYLRDPNQYALPKTTELKLSLDQGE